LHVVIWLLASYPSFFASNQANSSGVQWAFPNAFTLNIVTNYEKKKKKCARVIQTQVRNMLFFML